MQMNHFCLFLFRNVDIFVLLKVENNLEIAAINMHFNSIISRKYLFERIEVFVNNTNLTFLSFLNKISIGVS